MKKIFSILTIALIATAIVSCDKEDEKTNDNGTELNIPANTLIYDGNTYTFSNVMVDYYHNELTLVSAETADLVDDQPRLAINGIHITPETWNKTLNLAMPTQWPEGVSVTLNLSGAIDIAYEAWNNEGHLGSWGTFDGAEIDNTNLFTSGTYRVSGNNDGTPITVTYDAVLKNGKKIQIKLVSGSYNTNIR